MVWQTKLLVRQRRHATCSIVGDSPSTTLRVSPDILRASVLLLSALKNLSACAK